MCFRLWCVCCVACRVRLRYKDLKKKSVILYLSIMSILYYSKWVVFRQKFG